MDTEEQTDPNPDLVGKVVTIADREWTVLMTSAWSDQYVMLTSPGEPGSGKIDMLCRPTAVVRRHLQLVG